MYFAERVRSLRPEGAYAVLAKAQEMERQGRDIVHFEIGQPDFQTFPNIAMAGIRAIAEGKTRYNPSSGLPALREAVAEDVNDRRGLQVRPEEGVIGPGAKPLLFFPPNFYDDSNFKWSETHLDMLANLKTKVTKQELIMLLVQKGDDLLDYKEAVNYLPNSHMIVENGGSHSFEGIEKQFKNIVEFLHN